MQSREDKIYDNGEYPAGNRRAINGVMIDRGRYNFDRQFLCLFVECESVAAQDYYN